ncbi:hypothetical protein J6590_006616 [Homalodisca vitripennis]|nr:hypothetical protein J6590_006616 [Homalodisca vitripennis]
MFLHLAISTIAVFIPYIYPCKFGALFAYNLSPVKQIHVPTPRYQHHHSFVSHTHIHEWETEVMSPSSNGHLVEMEQWSGAERAVAVRVYKLRQCNSCTTSGKESTPFCTKNRLIVAT